MKLNENKRILPDPDAMIRLKRDFFVPYSQIAEWMGVSREYARQVTNVRRPERCGSWQSDKISREEEGLILAAAKNGDKRYKAQGCEAVYLNNGIDRAAVFVATDAVKCVFDLPKSLLSRLEETDPEPDCSGELAHKNGRIYFKPNDRDGFAKKADQMHISQEELSMMMYGAPLLNSHVAVTDEEVRAALKELSDNGVIKNIPDEYRWLRGQAFVRRTTIREYIELFGFEYTGRKESTRKPWTKEEDGFLIRYYKEKGTKWCEQRMPGRTCPAIEARTKLLGIRKPTNRWSDEEEMFLIENYKAKGPTWCAKHLDRSIPACRGHAGKLGLWDKRPGKRSEV